MATKVYKEEEISLQDGTDVTVRPLPIGRLRRFMDAWSKFGDAKSEDEGFKVLVDCAGISIEHEFKGKFDSLKAPASAENEWLSEEYKEYCEEVLDLDTIYMILEVAGGLKLNDPKLMEAAMQAAMESQAQDGNN